MTDDKEYVERTRVNRHGCGPNDEPEIIQAILVACGGRCRGLEKSCYYEYWEQETVRVKCTI